MEGDDKALSKDWRIRQRWSFTIEAEDRFVEEKEWKTDEEVTNGEKYQGPREEYEGPYPFAGFSEPEDLAKKLQTWGILKKERLYVLSFLTFDDEGGRQVYERHHSSLCGQSASDGNAFGVQVHLSSTVTSTTGMDRYDQDKQSSKADPMERFVLMSFPSAKKYAEYLLSEEYQILEEAGARESMVLATMMKKLPPKEQVINTENGEWGDAYQPPGIDFFGWGGYQRVDSPVPRAK